MTGNSKQWFACAGETAGSGHLEREIPCQDRAIAWIHPHPCIMVLDGRGSASHSQVGAAAARLRLQDFLRQRDDEISSILDAPSANLSAIGWKSMALAIYYQAASEQLKLARFFDLRPQDFEFTLTLALIGTARVAWLAVGDSPLVILKRGILGLVTTEATGDFANQTQFVTADPGESTGLQAGLIPIENLNGIAAMSDGAATRLIDLRQQTAAEVIRQLLVQSASNRLDPIPDLFAHAGWKSATRDDLSLAFLTCLQAVPHAPDFPRLPDSCSPS